MKKGTTLVVSAFIRKEDKYLLVFDPKFGFWRVPGGRPDFEETVEEALKREMKEELEIEVEILNFLGFGQDWVELVKKDIDASRLILYFECGIKEGKVEPQQPWEISKLKWLTLEKIKNHSNLEPGMKDLFKRFYYESSDSEG